MSPTSLWGEVLPISPPAVTLAAKLPLPPPQPVPLPQLAGGGVGVASPSHREWRQRSQPGPKGFLTVNSSWPPALSLPPESQRQQPRSVGDSACPPDRERKTESLPLP